MYRIIQSNFHVSPYRDLTWLLRSAVVFIVSALDCYFHDKIKYRVGKVDWNNLPPVLAQLSITLKDLLSFSEYKRKRMALQKLVGSHIFTRQIVGSTQIPEFLQLIGITKFWSTLLPEFNERKKFQAILNKLVKRRNQIAHAGDLMAKTKGAMKFRPIELDQTNEWQQFVIDFVEKVERKFPN